jgi:polyhydroxybutyrate depolymerase
MMFRLFLLFAALAGFPSLAAACEGAVACTLGERSYHVLPPDDWDGTEPLPVLLHFHGWGRQGDLVVRHDRIASATRRRCVLLLAPNGRGRTWDFWRAGSSDVDFAADVIEDAARHYPIDRSRIYISGYSYGGAMAWRYVCQNGNGVAALLAISGTIDQDETCPQASKVVRHVHGLSDNVMRFPMGPGGDVTFPVALWRSKFGCGTGRATGDWNAVPFLTLSRSMWTDCEGSHDVTLDLHPGGHFIPHGWIARQLDELMGDAPRYP